MAYDVLAANAILLLPRVFSILDHYQSFFQLLIAFRLMAVDLAAVFVLALDDVPHHLPLLDSDYPHHSLHQLLHDDCIQRHRGAPVSKAPGVLDGSFLARLRRFLFAINTIAMVKSDALFSYIAPSNIFAWLFMPLRYCMPLKHFVWLNRIIIKVTHFPVLFCIYLYERFWLAPSMYEPTDLVENHGRSRPRTIFFRNPAERSAMFSPNVRVREESVAGFHKDRALEEVFRRVPKTTTLRTQRRNERRKTQMAIRHWMDQNDEAGMHLSNWLTMDSRVVPDWQRRLSVGWDRSSHFRQVSDVRSTASDPADLLSNHGVPVSRRGGRRLDAVAAEYKDHTDADGNDELVTNDEDEDDAGTNADRSHQHEKHGVEDKDYLKTPVPGRAAKLASSHDSSAKGAAPSPRQGAHKRGGHDRTLSTNIILYKPEEMPRAHGSSPSTSPPKKSQGRRPGTSGRSIGADTPGQAGRRSSPRRSAHVPASHPRPRDRPRGLTETGASAGRPCSVSTPATGYGWPGGSRRWT